MRNVSGYDLIQAKRFDTHIQDLGDIFVEELLLEFIRYIDVDQVEILEHIVSKRYPLVQISDTYLVVVHFQDLLLVSGLRLGLAVVE